MRSAGHSCSWPRHDWRRSGLDLCLIRRAWGNLAHFSLNVLDESLEQAWINLISGNDVPRDRTDVDEHVAWRLGDRFNAAPIDSQLVEVRAYQNPVILN